MNKKYLVVDRRGFPNSYGYEFDTLKEAADFLKKVWEYQKDSHKINLCLYEIKKEIKIEE